MKFIFSMPVLIRHLWQLKTVVFLHWCLICTVPIIEVALKWRHQLIKEFWRHLEFKFIICSQFLHILQHNVFLGVSWSSRYAKTQTKSDMSMHLYLVSNLTLSFYIILVHTFVLNEILSHFISFMTEIFRFTKISQLPIAYYKSYNPSTWYW